SYRYTMVEGGPDSVDMDALGSSLREALRDRHFEFFGRPVAHTHPSGNPLPSETDLMSLARLAYHTKSDCKHMIIPKGGDGQAITLNIRYEEGNIRIDYDQQQASLLTTEQQAALAARARSCESSANQKIRHQEFGLDQRLRAFDAGFEVDYKAKIDELLGGDLIYRNEGAWLFLGGLADQTSLSDVDKRIIRGLMTIEECAGAIKLDDFIRQFDKLSDDEVVTAAEFLGRRVINPQNSKSELEKRTQILNRLYTTATTVDSIQILPTQRQGFIRRFVDEGLDETAISKHLDFVGGYRTSSDQQIFIDHAIGNPGFLSTTMPRYYKRSLDLPLSRTRPGLEIPSDYPDVLLTRTRDEVAQFLKSRSDVPPYLRRNFDTHFASLNNSNRQELSLLHCLFFKSPQSNQFVRAIEETLAPNSTKTSVLKEYFEGLFGSPLFTRYKQDKVLGPELNHAYDQGLMNHFSNNASFKHYLSLLDIQNQYGPQRIFRLLTNPSLTMCSDKGDLLMVILRSYDTHLVRKDTSGELIRSYRDNNENFDPDFNDTRANSFVRRNNGSNGAAPIRGWVHEYGALARVRAKEVGHSLVLEPKSNEALRAKYGFRDGVDPDGLDPVTRVIYEVKSSGHNYTDTHGDINSIIRQLGSYHSNLIDPGKVTACELLLVGLDVDVSFMRAVYRSFAQNHRHKYTITLRGADNGYSIKKKIEFDENTNQIIVKDFTVGSVQETRYGL
ncbi:hypothetical protein KJ708_08000, partial [bacterium]|nr:hypothetical protein [bacterium]